MKIILATVFVLVLGAVAQAGAPQAPVGRAVNAPGRYWLSDGLNRLTFWHVRAPAQETVARAGAPSSH